MTNDSSHPVPVVFPTPVDVVSPLWQGEPSAVRSGALPLDGCPVIAARGCLSGIKAAAGVSFLGFTVPLPQ